MLANAKNEARVEDADDFRDPESHYRRPCRSATDFFTAEVWSFLEQKRPEVDCKCSCCVFQQSLMTSGTVFGTPLPPMKDFEEDYQTWSDLTGSYRHSYGNRTTADPNTTEGEEKAVGGVGSDPGNALDQKRPHCMEGRDNYGGHGTLIPNQSSGCDYQMDDCPQIDVKTGGTYDVFATAS